MAEKIWAWQPFGPNPDIKSLAVVGSHYRGFPVIKITDDEKQQIEQGNDFAFKYRGTCYVLSGSQINEVQ